MSTSHRNHLRNKSGPSSSLPSPTTPRTFLPPSYFAAAAGLEYQYHSPITNDASSACSISSGSQGTSTMYPTQMPSDLSSASDSDHVPPAGIVSRLTRRSSHKHSNTGAPGSKSDRPLSLSKQKRRETQVEDLAHVETQLIPSLRDTIERMTHPTSSGFMADTPPTSNSPHLQQLSSNRTNISSPRLQNLNSSPSAFRTTPNSTLRPILKSSLRTPTLSPSAAATSPQVNSLRSVKSMNATQNGMIHNPTAHQTVRSTNLPSTKASSSSSSSRAYSSNPMTPDGLGTRSVPVKKQSASQLASRIPTAALPRRNPRNGRQRLDEGAADGGKTPRGFFSPILREEAPWKNSPAILKSDDYASRISRSGLGLGFDFMPLDPQVQGQPSLCAEEEPEPLFDDTCVDKQIPTVDVGSYEEFAGVTLARVKESKQERTRRKRRDTLLAIVDGIQIQSDANTNRESSIYGRSGEPAIESSEFTVTQQVIHLDQMSDNIYDDLSSYSEDEQDETHVAAMLRSRLNHRFIPGPSNLRTTLEGSERSNRSRKSMLKPDTYTPSRSPRISNRHHPLTESDKDLVTTPTRQSRAPSRNSERHIISNQAHPDRLISTSMTSRSGETLDSHEIYNMHLPSGKRRSVSTPASVSSARHRANMEDSKSRQESSGIRRTGYSHEGVPPFAFDDLHEETLWRASRDEPDSFGIPPSLSYDFQNVGEGRNPEIISRVESDSSLLSGSDRWREDANYGEGAAESSSILSVGAETLFRGLENQNATNRDMFDEDSTKSKPSFRRAVDQLGSSYSQASVTSSESSVASIYEEDIREQSPEFEVEPYHRKFPAASDSAPLAGKSWKSTLPPSTYRSLVARSGETEIQRQEIIWDLCESESIFVKRLKTIVRLFIKPLRMQDTASWIEGIPAKVARLFDWLEDIMNLHVQISEGLKEMRHRQYPVVERVAEVVKVFVSRLEVYQPYLVRVGEVAGQVAHEVKVAREGRGETSDFGEFVMIQEQDVDCEGWNLETLLLEPVNRLAKYSELFQMLWNLTPHSHVDYLPTLSLVHSTEMMIRVLQEVKVREEEYNLVKGISAAIEGLPSFASLARRERRLLARGSLCRHYAQDHLVKPPDTITNNSRDFNHLPHPRPRELSRRSVVLLNAINDWDAQQPEHINSSGASLNSSSTSSVQMAERIKSSPGRFRLLQQPEHLYQPSLSDQETFGSSNQQRPLNATLSAESKQSLVDVFVFTDLVLLTTPLYKRQARGSGEIKERWRLLEDIGMARILGVTERREVIQGQEESVIMLDLLPVDIESLETGEMSRNESVATIILGGRVFKERDNLSAEHWNKWLNAFQQCFQFTLRSLSFPSHSGKYLAHGSNVDLEADTRETVTEILNSGLPLPKSPSVQVRELSSGIQKGLSQEEREERGWWAVRFRQVFREIQRQDVSLLSLGAKTGVLSMVGGSNAKIAMSAKMPSELDSSSSSLAFTSQPVKESSGSWVL